MQISSWQNCSVHCQAGVVSVEQVALSTSRLGKLGKLKHVNWTKETNSLLTSQEMFIYILFVVLSDILCRYKVISFRYLAISERHYIKFRRPIVPRECSTYDTYVGKGLCTWNQ